MDSTENRAWADSCHGEFKIKNSITPHTFREIYAHYFFRRGISLVLMIVLFAYTLLLLSAILYSAIFLQIAEIEAIIAAVIFILLMGLRVWQYHSYSSLAYKRLCESNAPMEYEINVDSEKLWKDDDREHGIEVKSVRSVCLTRNYLYLTTSARQLICLCRDGFTVGNEDGLLAHFYERGVRVPKSKG